MDFLDDKKKGFIKNMSIFVTQSSMASFEEYIEEIKPIFETKRLTNMGPIYKKMQHQLIDYLQVPELSLFVNGHMALEMAIQTMDFPSESEIITTPYTFVSTTHAIARNGLTPVFCDINPDDYTIDTSKIEKLITDKTVAILPVHVYGNICNIEAIQEIANKYHLKVIYDAAHAFGVKYKGTTIGNFGDMSMFSFHATKVFHTVEGGAITFKDKDYCLRLHELKNFGIHSEDNVGGIGTNAKLDEFRAAMGICNLRHIDESIAARKRIVERYNDNFKNDSRIKTMSHRKELTPNYSYYPIYVDPLKFGKTRDDIYQMLNNNDIYARKYFYPAINDMECYREKYAIQETPVARDVSNKILTLPLYEDLAITDVDRISKLIMNM